MLTWSRRRRFLTGADGSRDEASSRKMRQSNPSLLALKVESP
jgi:hypothetical protein